MRIIVIFISLYFTLSHITNAGEVFSKIPLNLDSDGKYIVYSHGLIVEGTNPRPVHPNWGIYEFPAIKNALSEPDFTVIALHRSAGIDAKAHSLKLVSLVRELISKGIRADQITMVGFSQGGYITALASNELVDTPIDTVILAACWSWIEKEKDVKLNGNVLSIFELSDEVGSCGSLEKRSGAIHSYKEISINTGKNHGAFFQPREQWIEPIKGWINSLSHDN